MRAVANLGNLAGFAKLGAIIAFLAGSIIGFAIEEFFENGVEGALKELNQPASIIVISVFLVLTSLLFSIDLKKWGIPGNLARALWIFSFLVGSVGIQVALLLT